MSLNPDSSQDDKLKIRDLLGIIVGDYYCDDLLNQQKDNKAIVALAAEEAIGVEEVERREQDDAWDRLAKGYIKGSVETVTEFLRPRREHRKPAQNRYFTS